MKPNYRRCVSCRKVALKDEFWRIVRVYPFGELQLNRGMGRSAYLCPQVSCLQAAQKKNKLGRALRISVPEALYQSLWQRLSHNIASSQPRIDSAALPSPPKPNLLASLEKKRHFDTKSAE